MVWLSFLPKYVNDPSSTSCLTRSPVLYNNIPSSAYPNALSHFGLFTNTSFVFASSPRYPLATHGPSNTNSPTAPTGANLSQSPASTTHGTDPTPNPIFSAFPPPPTFLVTAKTQVSVGPYPFINPLPPQTSTHSLFNASPPNTTVLKQGTSSGFNNLTNDGVKNAQSHSLSLINPASPSLRSASVGTQIVPPKCRAVKISAMHASKV